MINKNKTQEATKMEEYLMKRVVVLETTIEELNNYIETIEQQLKDGVTKSGGAQ